MSISVEQLADRLTNLTDEEYDQLRDYLKRLGGPTVVKPFKPAEHSCTTCRAFVRYDQQGWPCMQCEDGGNCEKIMIDNVPCPKWRNQ